MGPLLGQRWSHLTGGCLLACHPAARLSSPPFGGGHLLSSSQKPLGNNSKYREARCRNWLTVRLGLWGRTSVYWITITRSRSIVSQVLVECDYKGVCGIIVVLERAGRSRSATNICRSASGRHEGCDAAIMGSDKHSTPTNKIFLAPLLRDRNDLHQQVGPTEERHGAGHRLYCILVPNSPLDPFRLPPRKVESDSQNGTQHPKSVKRNGAITEWEATSIGSYLRAVGAATAVLVCTVLSSPKCTYICVFAYTHCL